MMKKKRSFIFIIFLFFTGGLFTAGAEEFVFKYREGDKYRILSSVREDVFVDKEFIHHADIINRIAVEVTEVNDGTGSHRAMFQTAERAEGLRDIDGYLWSREYESIFDRDGLGNLSIGSQYYMPVVRNVPLFPGRELDPGDTWTADGHEMHDFRDSFGIADPYSIPFTANYEYLGERTWKGKPYPAFSVSYSILAEPPAVRGTVWPRRIQGESNQVVYWDIVLGQTIAYEETFTMVFELSDGRTIEFTGDAEAEIIEAPAMDKETIVNEIENELRRLNIPNASVRITDEGVSISIENIQFLGDSAVLLPSEQRKLDQISGILMKYPDRDILVGGHTALAGTASGRMELSRERAGTVAEYLIENGVRTADRMVIQGYGAERPLADNSTEAGRERNRRVEITILEN